MSESHIKLRDGRIVRSEEPLNLEMPFETTEGFITPTRSFYVRTHFPIPNIDRDAWWLHVESEVEKRFAINYEELVELESLTVPLALLSGLVCHCLPCLIGHSLAHERAKSFLKELMAEYSKMRKVRPAS